MDFFLLLPEIVLAVLILVFFAATLVKSRQSLLNGLAVAGALCVFAAAWWTYGRSGLFFHDVYKIDTFSQTFKLILSLGLVLILWMGAGLRGITRSLRPEYYLFLFFSCYGLFVMTSAVELVTIIIGMELSLIHI